MRDNIIKTLYVILFIGLLVAASAIRVLYWHHQDRYPTSSQAMLNANLIPVSSKITGTVSAVRIGNNTYVKRGDILFEVDSSAYQSAVTQAEQALKSIKSEVRTQQNAVTSAQKLVEQRQAELSEVSKNVSRGQASNDEMNIAGEQLELALMQLDNSFQVLGKQGIAQAKIKTAQEALATAKLNLGYAYIAAPADGLIYHLGLKMGDHINAQQEVFSLIENNEWWVNANFKPSALKHIQPRQLAIIKLGLSSPINGIVESINGSSVKIKVINPVDIPLSVGSSCQVVIDTNTNASTTQKANLSSNVFSN